MTEKERITILAKFAGMVLIMVVLSVLAAMCDRQREEQLTAEKMYKEHLNKNYKLSKDSVSID